MKHCPANWTFVVLVPKHFGTRVAEAQVPARKCHRVPYVRHANHALTVIVVVASSPTFFLILNAVNLFQDERESINRQTLNNRFARHSLDTLATSVKCRKRSVRVRFWVVYKGLDVDDERVLSRPTLINKEVFFSKICKVHSSSRERVLLKQTSIKPSGRPSMLCRVFPGSASCKNGAHAEHEKKSGDDEAVLQHNASIGIQITTNYSEYINTKYCIKRQKKASQKYKGLRYAMHVRAFGYCEVNSDRARHITIEREFYMCVRRSCWV